MKYKKGEKLNSIGEVYEHLYGGGVVMQLAGIYRLNVHVLEYRLDHWDDFERATFQINDDKDIYKAVEEKEELKMPEFFKVYTCKADGVNSIITDMRDEKGYTINISGDWYGLEPFWETFEEATES